MVCIAEEAQKTKVVFSGLGRPSLTPAQCWVLHKQNNIYAASMESGVECLLVFTTSQRAFEFLQNREAGLHGWTATLFDWEVAVEKWGAIFKYAIVDCRGILCDSILAVPFV